jgi:ABC-2 type transport system permease protein
MLRSVFGKTLWDARGGLVGWMVALVLVTVVYGAFYPSINTEVFAQAMDAFPEGIMAAFGWNDLTSPAGYLGSAVFGLLVPILLLVYATGAGSRAVAGDEESGTLDLLLAHPVSRDRVVLERVAALAVVMALTSTVVLLTVLALRVPAQLTALPVGHVAAASFQLALFGLFFGCLALAVGAVTGRRALAVSVTAVVAVVGYFANTVAAQLDATAWLRTLSPFYWYMGGEPLRHGLQVGDSVVLLLASAVLVVLAVVGLRRRDVGV